MIDSHHHDQTTGGRVFAYQALFVGHQAARAKMLEAADPVASFQISHPPIVV